MAIYDHKYGDLPYLRVFRAWGGKEYQEYVRIKRSRKAAYAKALQIDKRLAEEQNAFYVAQTKTVDYHVRSDGHIRGIRRILVTRKGRKPSDVFELRINVPWEKEIRRTTISIQVHGFEKAFEMSVNKVCDWYGLDSDSDVAKAMLACRDNYLTTAERAAGIKDNTIQKAREEIVELTGTFFSAIKRFAGQ